MNTQPAQTHTLWMLMAEFNGRGVVPLDECKTYLGYATTEEANRAAVDNKLPVPAFRIRDSKRSPRHVHLSDLAEHIDQAREKAARDWRATNNIPEPAAEAITTGRRRKNRAA